MIDKLKLAHAGKGQPSMWVTIHFSQEHYKVKVMVEVFSICQGVLNHKFIWIPEHATLTKGKYKKALAYLWKLFHLKHPKIRMARDSMLLYDSAPAHQLLLMQQ